MRENLVILNHDVVNLQRFTDLWNCDEIEPILKGFFSLQKYRATSRTGFKWFTA